MYIYLAVKTLHSLSLLCLLSWEERWMSVAILRDGSSKIPSYTEHLKIDV